MQDDLQKLRIALFATTAAPYALIWAIVLLTGFRLDYSSLWRFMFIALSILAVFSPYCSWRRLFVLRNIVETLCCGLLLIIPSVISTYLAIRVGMPMVDDQLVAMDAMLPIDWRSFIAVVDAHGWIAHSLGYAYQSFALQLLGLPVLLCVLGKPERGYRMVMAYAAICFLSSLISIWFPALGTYKIYGVAADSLQNINAHFGYFFLEQFHAVRENGDFIFSLDHAAGILTFPSVHAAVAALCAWAAWEIRLIRYPILVLNIGMAISAVSHANHYFVDIIAGVMVAVVCIAVVGVVTRSPRLATASRMAVTA
ncbi:phosphatase PAP2 family protein [Neorhizobium galegae]|uniref:phosphatase PAP2 family protein n=1 Tax=Neorhizobium galegae TaxID=399 RepID=UPI001F3FBFC4|nr:phosphatase PAP2 family protein [Neorhizobium galegae]UIK03815.1 phosphatase PAP2 family protein [Neorhizobium galegae]